MIFIVDIWRRIRNYLALFLQTQVGVKLSDNQIVEGGR
jgi:hypothetical protein